MTNNSAGFELDHQRVVLERIQDDTSMFILDTGQDMCGKPEERFIIDTAQLLIPVENDLESVYKCSAFIAGATTVLVALKESDQRPEVIKQIQRNPLLNRSPTELVNATNDNFASFEREAIKGIKAHPEIKDHLDYIISYFVEVTQDSEYGQYARIGGGLYAARLDQCFDAVMDAAASSWIGEEIKLVDWDTHISNLLDGYI